MTELMIPHQKSNKKRSELTDQSTDPLISTLVVFYFKHRSPKFFSYIGYIKLSNTANSW